MFITVPSVEPGADVTFDTDKLLSMTYVDKRKLKSDVLIGVNDDEKPVTIVKLEHGVAFGTPWSPTEILGELEKVNQLING